ncbi:uncharacterized protein LOC134199505 [Bombyx mori]|uniref:uncharacterized protein LOC134199505 n=1 Tax=Bombyx mori TaxID=7091 RepID=UPI002ED09988
MSEGEELSPCEQDIFERDLILDELKRIILLAKTNEQQFRSRTIDLAAHQRKFTKVQTKIEKFLIRSKSFSKDDNIKIRNYFNDLYYEIVGHLNSLKSMDERQRRFNRSSNCSFDAIGNDKRNLPTLPLPEFKGDPTDWPSFYDLFKSLVHSNNAYSKAEKLRYLLLAVKNEPYNLIKSIPITEDNYPIALEILLTRYENKRVIASKHLDRILDIESCSDRSPYSVRKLLNVYQENMKALEVMDFPTHEWSFVLLQILLRKIPSSMRKGFERSLAKPSDIPEVDTLVSYLQHEIAAEEMVSPSSSSTSAQHANKQISWVGNPLPLQPRSYNVSPNSFAPVKRSFAANVSSDQTRPTVDSNKVRTCLKCNGSHILTKCAEFLNLSPQDRYSLVQNKSVCYNCLNVGHDVKNCISNFVCRTCHKRHHSLLHFTNQPAQALAVASETKQPIVVPLTPMQEKPTPIAVHGNCASNLPLARTGTVLLSTALVDIGIGNNMTISTVRCMVDTGSQASFITEACVQRLGLARRHSNVPVFGIGDTGPVHPKGLVSCSIAPKGQQQPVIPVNALILPELIPKMPSVPLPYTGWSHLKNLKLADPDFHTPQPVEMLLGADILSHVLLGNTIVGPPGTPIAMNSVFGYLLLGKLDLDSSVPTSFQVCFSSFDNDNLQRFWELESIPEKRSYTPDEELCESFFQKTHTRNADGRYVVALPFKPDAPSLGESRSIALARLHKLEYRLERNLKLKADYHACLQEYVDLNHMELVDDQPSVSESYYIPHHCVVKESSESTPTRVVYDAGCRSTSGYSLNDVLLTGPKLHMDIVDVLLKFRVHSIALTADIKQMYRNILVRESDKDFQRIVWRTSPEQTIRDYRLRTVTFGVKSSPYLALRTIKQLAQDEAERFKLASPVLLNDVFVDDVVSGEDSEVSALALQQELIGICGAAGFELRKWHSNSPALLAAVLPSESHGERPENVLFAEMEIDKKVKVLGLQWNPKSDSFNFKVQVSSIKCTKRVILSEIAKIYDPLGLLSPVTLFAKHLIQLLWIAKVDWDETPPVDIVNSWSSFVDELPLISQISFPRYIFNNTNPEPIQIHGFADASEKGFGACVYIRYKDQEDFIQTHLIIAKTRVAPLSVRLTIPRLELMAAVLLSKLIEKVMLTYSGRVRFDQVYAWSDASIVLAWLHSSPHEWKTFVSNRVSEILRRIPADRWRHVPSADNPADAASRGLLPAALVQHDLWYHGPSWLHLGQNSWPIQNPVRDTCEEKRNVSVCSSASTAPPIQDVDFITRFSSLGKLVRVTALIFRFFNKCKKTQQSFSRYITVTEYNFALNRLIRITQQSVFSEDIINIRVGKLPSTNLRRLTPYLDDTDELLKVGGRIHKSLLQFESKHQLILPKKHPLTNLIIDDAHLCNLHAGPQSVRYALLQRYWILSSRNIVRQRIHRCVQCFRARPTHNQPRMGPLPAVRVRPARPFLKTAVDFVGPFYVRANKVRNAKIIKCYVSVFVCMSVKAIHLELVSELSTEAFIAALRRFTSRRGLCTDIYSDCGKNFVGCNHYLQDLYEFLRRESVQSALNQQTLQQGITWHFQPPYASHFGGLHESGVRSFKHHLHRVVGNRIQTYDEMHTFLCQVEAILNSRPLCVLSSDASDPLSLTPSHFLIGEPMTALPDVSLIDESPNRLTRWRWIQQSIQHFWKRWSKEYLHELQQSNKWLQDKGVALREGTVVVVCDDRLPPLQWRLARIHELHPGSDNITRVVTIKMGNSLYKRPVVKICPLPLE